jgi:DNA-binding transcriptional MerR regulator
MSLSDQKGHSCSQVDAIAREHLAEVDAKIQSLKALRRQLDDIIRQCHSGTISECRIIDALGHRSAA